MDLDEQKKLQKHFLISIENDAVNMTTWEEEFIETVTPRIESNWILSRAQYDTLEAIYTRRVP